jgi:hypothetical protein
VYFAAFFVAQRNACFLLVCYLSYEFVNILLSTLNVKCFVENISKAHTKSA